VATGLSSEAFCGLMIARSAGRNGVGVEVGGFRRVGESCGVAVRDGRGDGVEEAGAGLVAGMGEVALACSTAGLGIDSLAEVHAVPRRMTQMRKAKNDL